MVIRAAVMGYKRLAQLFREIKLPHDLMEKLQLDVYDALFDEALRIAKRLEEEGAVDVFISGSANAAFIKPHLQTPVVTINVSAFDLMSAIKKASEYSALVPVVSFREPIEGLDGVVDVLKPSVIPVVYHSYDDLCQKIAQLRSQGCSVVVGASLACEIAEYHGLKGILVYSTESLRLAARHALEVGQSRRAEAQRAESLRAIINFAYSGIMVCDAEGRITLFNPTAERILGLSAKHVVGRKASEVIENSRIDEVLRTGQAELNQVQEVGQVKIVTNRVPIVTGNQVAGVVATFQDAGSIQQATDEIRRWEYKKGFKARTSLEDIVWASDCMGSVIEKARKFAHSDLPVLITGESGTGKELLAQGIHNESPRRNGPFVAINCAALNESLLESELFGYEEGAFTGARRGGKVGLFELAHRGTIFLDEIGDISPGLQSRLLRVLQEKEILRVGGTRVIPVDVRVIASTNRNLWELVCSGKFREDLYYRLNVLRLNVPPLRERKEDIPAIVKCLLQRRSEANSALLDGPRLNAICSTLLQYDWPGNVRELENIIDRLLVLLDGRAPAPRELAAYVGDLLNSILEEQRASSPRGVGGHADTISLMEAIHRAGGNKAKAARLLGISRTTLWRRLKRLSDTAFP